MIGGLYSFEMAADVFWVGEWRVEPGSNEMRLEGAESGAAVRLEPKVMDVLVVLARARGDVVSRQQLLAEVWGGLHVSEDALNRVISRLRKVLRDDSAAPRCIATVRQRGYRLVAPVRFAERPAPPDAAAATGGRTRRRFGTTAAVVAIAVLWIGYRLADSSRSYRPGARLGRPAPVTSLPGEERSPALSPDGRTLAFLWNGQGLRPHLYLKPTASEDVRRLTDDDARYGAPAWSPDGGRLAVVRRSAARQVVVFEMQDGVAVSPPRSLGRVGEEAEVDLDWSPDGRWLVLTDQPRAAASAGLYRLDVETGRQSLLATSEPAGTVPRYPVFIAGGASVAFVRSRLIAADEICLVPVAGGEARVLLEVSDSLDGLAATAGGGLVFAVSRGLTGELWRWHPEDGAPRRLASSERFFDLRATPGGAVLFAHWTFDANLWRLDLLTGGSSDDRPVAPSSRWDSSPAFSGSGDLAFLSRRSGNLELWRARADGSDVVRLTSFEGASLGPPSWSPDGRRIALRVDDQVHVVDASHPEHLVRSVTNGPASHYLPSWSHDGSGLYVVSSAGDDWSIWRFATTDSRVAGGALERLTDGTSVRESADASAIYFTRRQLPGLWRRSLASGVEERVIDDLDPDDRLNWTLAKAGIYFVATTDAGRRIAFFDFATGRRQELADARSTPYYGGLAVSPGADALLFVRVDRSDSDLMMARLEEP